MSARRKLWPGLLGLVLAVPATAADVAPCLPADTDLVLVVQLRQLLDAPLVKEHFQPSIQRWVADQPTLRRLSKSLALDPLRDFASVMLVSPLPVREERGACLVRGRFDLSRIKTAVAQDADVKTLKLGQHVAYRFDRTGDGGDSFVACFLNDSTLALTPTRAVLEEILAWRDDPKRATVDAELQTLIDKADAWKSVWLAARVTPALKKEWGTSPAVEKVLAGVQSLSGGANVGDGLRVQLRLQTRDAKSANDVRPFLEGFKSILSLASLDNGPNVRAAAALLAGIKIATDGNGVTIQGNMSKEDVAKAVSEKAKQ